MIRARAAALLALSTLLALATPARAETHRIAVVVGNNAGGPRLPALRYAEDDAAKIGRVMVELGGVAAPDLFLVRAGDRATVEDALARASARIAAWRRAPGGRVILFFYFSGHSDGVALELGRDRLAFSDLRRWLATTGAEVRLAMVDTCKSGALLAAKGGAPGAGFQIRLSEDLSSNGEALLTSSAADEVALESREIGGSFFTHHLVSGLRGAADASGDGRVTLTEAYQYAYTHTITTTGATLAGPQHPVYDYRLTGRGDLVLTELSRRSARLEVPPGVERALIVDEQRHEAIAELAPEAPRTVAVVAGRYTVRVWLGGKTFQGSVRVATGETRAVRWSDLAATTAPLVVAKGDPAPRDGLALWLAVGAQRGIADALAPVPALRVGVLTADGHGALSLAIGTGRGDHFRETSAVLSAGLRGSWSRGRLRLSIGGDLGAGTIVQRLDHTSTAWSPAVVVGPTLGIAYQAGERFRVALDARLDLTLLRRDDAVSATLLPGLWLGAITPL